MSPLLRSAQPAEMGSHSQRALLLAFCPLLRFKPAKRNIFWRPSSKLNSGPQLGAGEPVSETGVRLVQFALAPSHSQTELSLSTAKSSTFPRPESVTMPGQACGPGLDLGKSWLHWRVPLCHSQVSLRSKVSLPSW